MANGKYIPIDKSNARQKSPANQNSSRAIRQKLLIAEQHLSELWQDEKGA
jgi:hypothetical protein